MTAAGATEPRGTLTDVPGFRVGHAAVEGGRSGSTVVLGPFRGAVEVGGTATGTREMETLEPTHTAPRADAVLLTGGSAWGLAAADGVMDWLAEQGRGFPTAPGIVVPIVPAAVIYDLDAGGPRPDAGTGRSACLAAERGPMPEGRVGAGAGATVGKAAGRDRSSPGGVGSAGGAAGRHRLGALAVVNAFGDVRGPDGFVVAGTRDEHGDLADGAHLLRRWDPGREGAAGAGPWTPNTTLGVVATDAPLSRSDLRRVARVAATAVARRVDPAHTPFDGDIVFALSSAEEVDDFSPGKILALGLAGRDLLEEAILRGVGAGVRDGGGSRRA